MNEIQIATLQVIFCLLFKTVDDKDAVVNVTWMYSRRLPEQTTHEGPE